MLPPVEHEEHAGANKREAGRIVPPEGRNQMADRKQYSILFMNYVERYPQLPVFSGVC
jgi:hypothetical protein